MSFVTITRDYVEFLNTLSDSLNGVIPFSEFLKESTFYVFLFILLLFNGFMILLYYQL